MSVAARVRRSSLTIALAVGAMLVAPLAASAAVSVNDNGGGAYTIAGDSTGNVLFISTPSATTVRFEDPGFDMVINDPADDHCVFGASNHIVICDFDAAGITAVNTLMGGGPDTIQGGNSLPATDLIIRHDGEEGSDWYITDADNTGADVYNDSGTGPTDRDTLDYTLTSAPVNVVMFPAAANDGRHCVSGDPDIAMCEEDDVRLTIDEVRGGSGGDNMSGGLGGQRFFGNGGHDVLNGQSSDDYIDGGTGSDTLIGGTENDTIVANDGVADAAINCGLGTDTASVDGIDPPSDGCETLAGPPTNVTRPVPPSGLNNVGSTLTSSAGTWTNAPTAFSYAWHRCTTTDLASCDSILGGDALSYVLAPADKDHYMTLCVVAANASGSSDPACSDLSLKIANVSAPTGGVVTATGTNYVGQEMTASATFGGGAATVTYKWYACDPIGNGCQFVFDGTSIKALEPAMGKRLKVIATASNIAGSASAERIGGIVGRAPSANCAGLDPKADPDSDGISNFVECNVVKFPDSLEFMDLPSLGADPKHRDIFLEIDKMVGYKITEEAVRRIMVAFDKAPLTNPDGTTGITIHIDNNTFTPVKLNSSVTWGNLSRANADVPLQQVLGTKVGKEYDWSEFDAIKKTKYDLVRSFAFHYAVVGQRYGAADEKSSGIARAGDFTKDGLGQDVIITVGASCNLGTVCNNGDSQQAGTIMHELGHNLGLGHGGRNADVADHANRKPNYASIMSYNWQFTGLVKNGETDGTLDYSRYGTSAYDSINENKLAESGGVKAKVAATKNLKVMWSCIQFGVRIYPTSAPNKATDFDCDLKTDKKTIKFSLNDDAFFNTLEPREDWSQLVYTGGAIGAAGAAASQDGTIVLENVAPPVQRDRTPVLEEKNSLAELVKSAASASGDRKPPKLAVKVGKRAKNGSLKVTITAIDARRVSEIVTRIDKLKSVSVTPAKKAKKATITVVIPKGKHSLTILAFDGVGNQTKLVRKFK